MRRVVSFIGALGAAAVLATAGCASLGLGGFKEPVVSFRGLSVNGIGLSGGNLDVQLSVYNPNGFKLEGTRLTYQLMVESTKVGEGALDSRFTVQDKDSTIVHLPVAFTYAGLGAAGRQLIQQGTVNYRVLGDVTVATPVGNFTRPYDRTGQFAAFSGARSPGQ